MKAFSITTTIGGEATSEVVFASDTRLAIQRAVFAATRETELKPGESLDVTVSAKRVKFTKEMKKKRQAKPSRQLMCGTDAQCARVRPQGPEYYGQIGDVLITPSGRVIGLVRGWDETTGRLLIRTLVIDGVEQPMAGCINFSLRERLKNLQSTLEEDLADYDDIQRSHDELKALGLGLE